MSKQEYVKPCPREAWEQVVKLTQLGDRRAREVAEEFGISVDSVRRWVKRSQLDLQRRRNGLSGGERKELAKPRRDARRLRMEREILARAAAWFAQETDSIQSGHSYSWERTGPTTRSP